MLQPADQLTMRATVIAGEKGKDDFVVIWNGIRIGRILSVAGVGGRVWNWGVAFPHRPQLPAPRASERPRGVQAAFQGRVVGDPS
jgi:hypothetical protein